MSHSSGSEESGSSEEGVTPIQTEITTEREPRKTTNLKNQEVDEPKVSSICLSVLTEIANSFGIEGNSVQEAAGEFEADPLLKDEGLRCCCREEQGKDNQIRAEEDEREDTNAT